MSDIINNSASEAEKELQLANLYQLLDLLGVMQQNLNLMLAGEQQNTTTVSYGNLFALASETYGDPTLWYAIAGNNEEVLKDENGFINPNLTGINTLIVPPKPSTNNGGILIV